MGRDGTLYLAGTGTEGFPVKNAYQSAYGGGTANGVLMKLSPSRTAPVIAIAPTAAPILPGLDKVSLFQQGRLIRLAVP